MCGWVDWFGLFVCLFVCVVWLIWLYSDQCMFPPFFWSFGLILKYSSKWCLAHSFILIDSSGNASEKCYEIQFNYIEINLIQNNVATVLTSEVWMMSCWCTGITRFERCTLSRKYIFQMRSLQFYVSYIVMKFYSDQSLWWAELINSTCTALHSCKFHCWLS